MAQAFIEQEREARAYNRAFLHGREYGLSDGKKIAIDQVLEIIDSHLPHGVIWQEDEWQVGWHDGVTKIRDAVMALKGGEQG